MKLPDWKDRDNYPDPKTATPQEWAWQFLRRNKEYQTAYKNLKKIEMDTKPSHLKRIEAAEKEWNKRKAINPNCKRILVSNKPVDSIKHKICLKFGITHGPIDPAERKPAQVQNIFSDNKAVIHLEEELEWFREKNSTKHEECLTMMREKTDSEYFQPDYLHYITDYFAHKINNNNFEKLEIDTKPSELTFSINIFGNINDQIKNIKSIVGKIRNKLKNEGSINDIDFIPITYLLMLQFHDATEQGFTKRAFAEEMKICDEFDNKTGEKLKKLRQKKDLLVQEGYKRLADLPPNWLAVRSEDFYKNS